MKTKSKHSIFFKGIVFALAFALAVLCFPIEAMSVFANEAQCSGDYHILTLAGGENGVKTSVNVGAQCKIPDAYIGGDSDWKIGKDGKQSGKLDDSVTLTSSYVKVSYFGQTITSSKDDGETVPDSENPRPAYTGTFTAEFVGTYVITYYYTYTENGQEVTNTYEYNVTSSISKASVDFEYDNISLVPASQMSVIDYSVKFEDEDKDIVNGTKLKDVEIRLPEVSDENGEKIDSSKIKFVAGSENEELTDEKVGAGDEDDVKVVLISAKGGNLANEVTVEGDAETGFYISGNTFKNTDFGEGVYTIKFSYYIRSEKEDGTGVYHFVTSNTKSFNVKGISKNSDGKYENSYYDNYELEIALESDWQNYNNGETGVEKDLPKPIGLTSDNTKPESEQVDVAYRVRVYYKKDYNDTYKELSTIKKNEELLYKDVLDTTNPEDKFSYGTLKDPSKFKPLQDGYYSFIYTVRDFYGHEVSNSNGIIGFEYLGTNNKGITDKTNPTPIVYDASATKLTDENYKEDIKDEDFKSRTYATSNSVIVYAIGMKDNCSEHGDENVEMYRRVSYDGVHQFTIDDFDDFNLIFNYRAANDISAWENLKTNNFNVEKEVRKLDKTYNEVKSNVDMLNWLAGTGKYSELSNGGYKIVVDNANYETIFDIFNAEEENFFEGKTVGGAAVTKENALDWFKTEEAKTAGFAYLDMDKTFGYYDNKGKDETKGYGHGAFKIEYVVKDAAGNEASKELTMTLYADETDKDVPTLTFKTSLKNTYLPTEIVTFDAPTSTDLRDMKMNEIVLYRYLDEQTKPISLFEADEQGKASEKPRATVDLDELWKDLGDVWQDNVTLKEKYSTYRTAGDVAGDDGYFDITDPTASTYSIDLNELSIFAAGKTATKLQILTYVYDDAGNPAIYAETVDIVSTVDNHPPKFVSVVGDAEDKTYYRGEEIQLNALEFLDDAVEFMKYEIKVTYTSDGTTFISVPVTGDYQERDGWDLKYTVHPGMFVASHAGDYQVSIKVSDGKENTIVYFKNFTVLERNLVQPPVIKSTLAKTQTVEIEGDSNYDPQKGIELPTPTVSYEIPNSVTYDVYSQNKDQYDSDPKTKYVVWGVKENGSVDSSAYSVTQGENNRFIPKALGDYEIKYNVKVRVYDFHKFTLNEKASWDRDTNDYKEGGTLSYTGEGGATATVKFTSEANTFEVADTKNSGTQYKVVVGSNSAVTIYTSDGAVFDYVNAEDESIFKDEKVRQDFGSLRNYILESEVYRVSVVDTKAPELKELPYTKAISYEKMKADGHLDIYGIQIVPNKAGINDIDIDKCSIVVYYTLPNGKEGGRHEYKGADAFVNHEYEDFPTTIHATYTIRYTIWDVNKNSDTSHVYTIAVGDVTPPTMTFPEDFVKDSYEIGVKKELEIDLKNVTFKDAGVEAENADAEEKFEYKPTVTLRNKSTNEEISATENSDGMLYFYPLDNVGTYVLTIEVQDSVGNTATQTFEFEVVSKTADTTKTYQVIGTVLIVISVLVLAGVIIFFIVSKVKLDKELKK